MLITRMVKQSQYVCGTVSEITTVKPSYSKTRHLLFGGAGAVKCSNSADKELVKLQHKAVSPLALLELQIMARTMGEVMILG